MVERVLRFDGRKNREVGAGMGNFDSGCSLMWTLERQFALMKAKVEVKERYLRGDKLRTDPSLILIRPAAEIRLPCRKEEC